MQSSAATARARKWSAKPSRSWTSPPPSSSSSSTTPTTILAATAICAPAKCCRTAPRPSCASSRPSCSGAIGHPDVKPGILEKGILLRMRFELEQYINLRPVKLYDERFCPLKDKKPEDIDFVVVRENNEGLYTGAGGFVFKGTPHEVAIQESVNTRRGVERCLRYAFEFARKRRRSPGRAQARGSQGGQKAADPLRQDQRADLRLRPLGAGLPRDRREGLSRTSSATTPTWTPPPCGS